MSKVTICECWARDGLQSVEQFIPTEKKVEIINRLSRAGFPRVEVTSFSNPARLPQFGDAEQVLRLIDRGVDARYKATCVNERALARALAARAAGFGPDEVSFVVSASEAHNVYNVSRPLADHWAELERMIEKAHADGLRVIATVLTAFGCPISGDVPEQAVLEAVGRYVGLGCTYVCIGDTIGAANPVGVKRVFGTLLDRFPGVAFIAHFHDTRGTGLANCVAALEVGVTHFDSSLGGIGGQPAGGARYQEGFTGNCCTEDLVCMFAEMGVDTGLDPDEVLEIGRAAEEVLGAPQRSLVLRAGRVRH